MNKTTEYLIVVLLAVTISFVLQTLIQGGYFNPKVLNHAPGPCRVFDVDGTEDVEILDNGLAIFSSGIRYRCALFIDARIAARKGRMYLFDMNQPNKEPEELQLKSFNRTSFNPHGISVYTDKVTGVVSVFVVNHRPDAQAIEIFDFDEKSKTLEFRRSVVDEKINSPNDVTASGRDSFYITNDRLFHYDSVFLRFIEIIFLSRWLKSGVVYFDGSKSYDVAGGMNAPNGIALSKDKRYLFVSCGMKHAINVYLREDTGLLQLVQILEIGTMVDNINVDPHTGDLWLGTIPAALEIVALNENIDHSTPSQVVYVKLGGEDPKGKTPFPAFRVREVYLNNGEELKGATGAAVYEGKLAVSAVFDKFMVCELRFY